jgi:hypothetical protein
MDKYIRPLTIGHSNVVEQLDCTVRALANSAGIVYGNAHSILKKHGRKDRKGCSNKVWHDAYINTGLSLVGIYGTTKAAKHISKRLNIAAYKGITLGRILPTLNEGSYIVIITGHALAVVSGHVIDKGLNRSNSSVVAVYKHS